MKFNVRLLLIGLVALPLVLTFANGGLGPVVRAEDEVMEDEEVQVEPEDGATGDEVQAPPPEDATEEEEDSTTTDEKTQGSPDIDISILFTKPVGNGMELPAGRPVEFLLGVVNSGDNDFIIDNTDASFRYPMDFKYVIQNFTSSDYAMTVKPKQEATVMYQFFASEMFAGRPLGLTVSLNYHDADGQDFTEAVFNSTVTITEVDDGLDTETFFLYIFLLAFTALLAFLGYTGVQSLTAGGAKKSAAPKKVAAAPSVEVGTQGTGVDYEWLPDQMKDQLKKAQNGVSTRTSPRLRKA